LPGAPKQTENVGFEPLWAPMRAICMARGRQARPLALPLPASAHACGERVNAPRFVGSPWACLGLQNRPKTSVLSHSGLPCAPFASRPEGKAKAANGPTHAEPSASTAPKARRQSKSRQWSDARGALSQHGSQGPKAKQKPPTVRRTRSPQPPRLPRPEGKAKAANGPTHAEPSATTAPKKARRQSKSRQRSDACGALSQHSSQEGPKAKQKPRTVRRTRSPQPARLPRRPEGKAKAAVGADIPNCETNVDRSACKQSKLPQVKADKLNGETHAERK
jgi:hypothetical protein